MSERPPPYTKKEIDRALWDIIAVSVGMLRNGEEPRAVGHAVTSAIHRVVETSRGSIRAAAEALKLARSTFLDQ